MAKQSSDIHTDEETAARRDAALLRALNTPHKKQADMKIGVRKRIKPSQRAKEKSPEQGPGSES